MSIDVSQSSPAAALSFRRASRADDASCAHCPLRRMAHFQAVNAAELAMIESLKQAEFEYDAHTLLVQEGQSDGPLYTLLEGWAFRFKTLTDGRRQILDFLQPGDFIGLQQKMSDAANHGVRAMTAVRLCSFARDALWTLHREMPSLGYDLTWLAAHSEAHVDENLLSVGRRTARERVAALLLMLHVRAAAQDPAAARHGVLMPLTQQHIADAMGLSLVHINRTLRQLSQAGLYHSTSAGHVRLPDLAALAALAKLRWPLKLAPRPLI